MTPDEIRACDKPWLTAADVAQVVGCDPQGIRITARKNPEWLGFPVICVKSRVKIPRVPFVRYMEDCGLLCLDTTISQREGGHHATE